MTTCILTLTALPAVAFAAETIAPNFMAEHQPEFYSVMLLAFGVIGFFLQRYLKTQDDINKQQAVINEKLMRSNNAILLRLERLTTEHEQHHGIVMNRRHDDPDYELS